MSIPINIAEGYGRK
ncbi:MAG: hypothetical protein KKE00_03100, partial [Proteobacteria bacterium]|nr:hypothetical protein [Pseudomonadota bacterium]